jgi:hypothetical protein
MTGGQLMDREVPQKGRPARRVQRPTRHISFEPDVLAAVLEKAPDGVSDFVNAAAKDYLRRKHGVKL